MSGRAWGAGNKSTSKRLAFFVLIALAITGLFAISSASWFALEAQLKSQRDSDTRTQHYADETYNPKRESCFALINEGKANCLAEASEGQRENERKDRDLVAQETSAAWASVMGLGAFFGVFISIAGIFLVWIAYQQSRTTNDIARSADRPWLDFEIVSFARFHFMDTAEGKMLRFSHETKVHNYGRSPALNVHIRFSSFVGSTFTPQDGIQTVFAKPSRGSAKIVFPDKSCENFKEGRGVLLVPSPDARDTGQPNAETVWLTVAVIYYDIFGIEHATGRDYTGNLSEMRKATDISGMFIGEFIGETWFA